MLHTMLSVRKTISGVLTCRLCTLLPSATTGAITEEERQPLKNKRNSPKKKRQQKYKAHDVTLNLGENEAALGCNTPHTRRPLSHHFHHQVDPCSQGHATGGDSVVIGA